MAAAKVRPLSADLQKTAIAELNEVPERIADDIEALKLWINQQPHLRARTDDQFLLAYLRGCKFSLERAKSKIDKFYSLRTKFPDIFAPSLANEARMLEVLRLGPIIYLPTPLHDNGPRIGIMRQGVCSPDKYSISDIMKVAQFMQEITLIEDDYAIVNGVVHIMDMANVTAGHLFQMTPSLSKKMTHWTEEAIPLRPKANHFVNTPMGFEPVFNMIKPMLSQKQQSRLYVHGNKMDLLHEQVPKKYLPKEYGGENGTFEEIVKQWEDRFITYRDYLKENENYGTDESLRPGKPIDYDNIFGVEGSFRKLNVD